MVFHDCERVFSNMIQWLLQFPSVLALPPPPPHDMGLSCCSRRFWSPAQERTGQTQQGTDWRSSNIPPATAGSGNGILCRTPWAWQGGDSPHPRFLSRHLSLNLAHLRGGFWSQMFWQMPKSLGKQMGCFLAIRVPFSSIPLLPPRDSSLLLMDCCGTFNLLCLALSFNFHHQGKGTSEN